MFKGPLAQPCRPALPSCHIPSHVLCSHIRGLCLYTRIVSSFSSGRKAASPQTSDPLSSAQKVSHPRPSLAAPFTLNSCLFDFLAALCSMWGWNPSSLQWKQSLNHWAIRDVPTLCTPLSSTGSRLVTAATTTRLFPTPKAPSPGSPAVCLPLHGPWALRAKDPLPLIKFQALSSCSNFSLV